MDDKVMSSDFFFYEWLYRSLFPSVVEINKFLDKIVIPKLSVEHMQGLEMFVTRQEIESTIYNFLKNPPD